ncbi:MAG: adenylosuccinate synthase [Zetaproteobacteria bacterium CG_4_9_14_3_um_filter_49_83]|nr:MAG: adenylosuccinate synthase [Zetaproteobacteria bacterium CG1_02_49_23]PIQ32584.1 MAG: adenylosuccinate synthase [Zetaproteobacteria bacterium CG17_big_fil_post_rev_8_21_14_2_50_50_13]PIV30683.1 MAG: adenylosuccinate synthase [Zetaproteobacteria bacterium CG02_land_8_20_14_3_00_50_9]PIY56476.1 MAG: adenylosuccinate synthase [Zetaproteobacteria bacterium CG_4_10_14_0_8_um_filter_49_80]PJA35579.1 MAG: adenylosuccinate synthase [Zetaproteobacteria bacterium CG_4_9_14_3_um_filter_49_83]
MKNTIAIGIQWGDEGKGKIVDLLAPQVDIVARFQGGPNAGHTLVIGNKKTVLHLVPSGILHDATLCLIGNGTVVAPETIVEEMDTLLEAGIPVNERLRISDRCQLILPYHRALDAAREVAKGKGKIGTTGRGIGPAYEDKTARRGIRLIDLVSEGLDAKLAENLAWTNFQLTEYFKVDPVSRADIDAVIELARERLLPLMADVSLILYERHKAGDSILFEGAQGTMLDVDFGTYPYVTSSNTVAGAALAGLGVGPGMIDEVLGICKAYTTRVGAGPFPTELYNADGMCDTAGKHLAEKGNEFGSTTGRPRRTGWFDAVVVRHAVRVAGVTGLAITKLDVLDGLEEVKLCTGYMCDSELLQTIPADSARLEKCEPVYETLSGWSDVTFGATSMDQIPEQAKAFLKRIEEVCECPITMLSTGPDRDHIIHM